MNPRNSIDFNTGTGVDSIEMMKERNRVAPSDKTKKSVKKVRDGVSFLDIPPRINNRSVPRGRSGEQSPLMSSDGLGAKDSSNNNSTTSNANRGQSSDGGNEEDTEFDFEKLMTRD